MYVIYEYIPLKSDAKPIYFIQFMIFHTWNIVPLFIVKTNMNIKLMPELECPEIIEIFSLS